MSVSRLQQAGIAVVVVVATVGVGYVVATGGAGAGEPASSTTFATPTASVDVVPKATAAQAAQVVSSRWFGRSEVAVLTAADARSRRAAIATATRLRVPVLLDDPAAAAELARLRATTVLTFGETEPVVGEVPVSGDADAVESAVDEAVGPRTTPSPPQDPPLLLVKSAASYDVAVATATAAGGTVLETEQVDPRLDPKVTAALAQAPDSPVLVIGAPFTDDLVYTLAAVQAKATQLDGSYAALPGHAYVSLHGKPGDADSGPAGALDTQEALDLLARAVPSHTRAAAAAGNEATAVGMLELVATDVDPADLETVLDAAEKAEVYTTLDLQRSDDSWIDQARNLQELLARPYVGLALEPDADGISAKEVDEVSAWLADLVRSETLPQKLFVVHVSDDAEVTDRDDVDALRPELSTVIQVDVAGTTEAKLTAWRDEQAAGPEGAFFGWTQVVDEDRPALTIRQIWRQVTPSPDVVSYR